MMNSSALFKPVKTVMSRSTSTRSLHMANDTKRQPYLPMASPSSNSSSSGLMDESPGLSMAFQRMLSLKEERSLNRIPAPQTPSSDFGWGQFVEVDPSDYYHGERNSVLQRLKRAGMRDHRSQMMSWSSAQL